MLIESERIYRNIVENITDIIWTVDLNYKTTYISPSVKKLFEDPAEMPLKMNLEDVFSERTIKKIHTIFFEEIEKDKDKKIKKFHLEL